MDEQAADGANPTDAPPEPARADPIAGDLVTASLAYDGGRQVTCTYRRMSPRLSYSPVTAN
jgi:hypothetical protein